MNSVSIGNNVTFGSKCYISCTDGGSLTIDDNVSICDNVKIVVQGGHVIIGSDVHIGDGCIITSKEGICIGAESLIAEYVVIRDQDHSLDCRPIRKSGFKTGMIVIGKDVWIGAKSSILRNCNIGNAAVVGAHSLIRSDIPEYTLAVGVPAKVIKHIK
ncbi:hypothetical protein KI655_10470 [Vibrio sp. D404a]|uniref:acyltransferase n=1 Tax=unclassified Vibrio TaxID=2614977 RepID=UPI00255460F5|nr:MULTISPECIES: hypothetical protein [unclassified Vibrio]MDK9737727.1 hypothetical protein [Vibrio sp. D404a]MDK9795329.1 hypothetical protein [Vibrio sp. D449a]